MASSEAPSPINISAVDQAIFNAFSTWWIECYGLLLACDADADQFAITTTTTHDDAVTQVHSWHREHEPPLAETASELFLARRVPHIDIPERSTVYLAARAAIAAILHNNIENWRLRWSHGQHAWQFLINVYDSSELLQKAFDSWYLRALKDPSSVERDALEMEAQYTHRLEQRPALLRDKIESAVAKWEESVRGSNPIPESTANNPIHEFRTSAAHQTPAKPVDHRETSIANPSSAEPVDAHHAIPTATATNLRLDTRDPPAQNISALLWEAFETFTLRPATTSSRTSQGAAAQRALHENEQRR